MATFNFFLCLSLLIELLALPVAVTIAVLVTVKVSFKHLIKSSALAGFRHDTSLCTVMTLWDAWTYIPRFKLGSMKAWRLVRSLIDVGSKFLGKRRRIRDEEDSDNSNHDGPPASRRLDGQKLSTSANPSLSYGSTEHCERNSLIPETNRDHAGRRRKESVLDEVVVHDQLSRTERVFRDRINSYDEEQLKSACNRMNFEITACTQSIVDEWSQLKPDSEKISPRRREPESIPKEVHDAVGDEILQRIQKAKLPPSSFDIEGTVEFALRAWVFHCVASCISASLLASTGPVVKNIARELAETDGSVAEGWKNLMREAKKTGRPINEETILYDAFRRLVEIYGPRGELSVALRWRALAYEVVSKHNQSVYDFMQDSLLGGMKEILKFADDSEDSTKTALEGFPTTEHVACLFDPVKCLADMMHTGFMTAIYEISFESPGAAYDGRRMESWDSESLQSDSLQRVVCTTELGLRRIPEPLTTVRHSCDGNLDVEKAVELVKPIVLL